MKKDIKAFARQHAKSLVSDALALIENVLERHNDAIIEYCCEQQQKIDALEAEVARYKRLYHAACEGRRHFREALRAANAEGR